MNACLERIAWCKEHLRVCTPLGLSTDCLARTVCNTELPVAKGRRVDIIRSVIEGHNTGLWTQHQEKGGDADAEDHASDTPISACSL